jgi:EAL domain-containing protein (putative c-di-GMP-specific phosphodiesterase class I)
MPNVDRDALARRWAHAIGDTGDPSMTAARLPEFIRGLVERVADALVAEPFDPEPGRQVGAALVDAGIAGSDALGHTIELLGAGLGQPAESRQARLLGALAEGFTHAMWQRTLDSARADREVARHELSASMPAGLARAEFVLEYQPLVLCGSETVIGAEALVRWRHPRLGLLPPDRFVGLAEETGMIVPLGLWVLEEACRQGRRWRDLAGDGAPLISVNLAVRQAQEPSLVDDVAAVLERTGLEPAYLQLELTESALIGPGHEPLAALNKLATMGVRIAIDDFGTGYSNLTYLRTLPVRAMKLAGSFVDGLRTPGRRPGYADLAGERMVATLVQLAHALDLTVTAEGVETQIQADRLRAVDCDSGQGFFYAPPGPPEQLTAMIIEQ